MSCIFCSIYENSKKSILYETESTFVILDRFPISKGHILVIPKIHHPVFHEYTEEEIQDILLVCNRVVKKFNLTSYNILQNNGNYQVVQHTHFHIIPHNNETERLQIGLDTLKMNDQEFEDYAKNYKIN